MRFYAPVQEDLKKSDGEPTMAQRMGGDVIVVRVGAQSMSRKKIQLAAETVRAAHKKSPKVK